jgi:hypothetical protein
MFGTANGDLLVLRTLFSLENEKPIRRRHEMPLGVLLKFGATAYMTSVPAHSFVCLTSGPVRESSFTR